MREPTLDRHKRLPGSPPRHVKSLCSSPGTGAWTSVGLSFPACRCWPLPSLALSEAHETMNWESVAKLWVTEQFPRSHSDLHLPLMSPHRAPEEATGGLHGPFPQREDSPDQETGRPDKDPNAGSFSRHWGRHHVLRFTL